VVFGDKDHCSEEDDAQAGRLVSTSHRFACPDIRQELLQSGAIEQLGGALSPPETE
jgi:hypothetical protein